MSNKKYAPTFESATENGEIRQKSGYHQPDQYPLHRPPCGCDKTTSKGAYRDVVVELPDGRVIHYYHQSPIAIRETDGTYRIDGFGYLTGPNGGIGTTAGRISDALPTGYTLRREDWDWYLETPDGRTEYESGMVVSP